MKRHLLVAAAAALLFVPSAFAVEDSSAAEEANEETVQVEPGEGPTEAITEQVPEMDKDSAQEQHPPTEAVGEEVPPMKPDDERLAEDEESSADDAQE